MVLWNLKVFCLAKPLEFILIALLCGANLFLEWLNLWHGNEMEKD